MEQPRTDKQTVEYESTQPVYEECIPDPDRPGVWTIPGYIASTGNVDTKGVDNPAFHDLDIPNVHFTHIPTTPAKKSTPLASSTSSSSSASSSPAKLKRTPLLRMWNLRVTKSVRRDRRATALLCVLVTALVLLLATIAVVLYLTVGGGLARLSSSVPPETRTASRKVEGSFRIINRIYSDVLSDRHSEEFIDMADEITSKVHSLFLRSSIADEYNSTEVTSLRNGSVIVELVVRLHAEIYDAAKKVGMAFERGLVNDYGQIKLGDFLIDFPSIRFSVIAQGTAPFALNHVDDTNAKETPSNSWIAHSQPPAKSDKKRPNVVERVDVPPTTTPPPLATIPVQRIPSTTAWTRLTVASHYPATFAHSVTATEIPIGSHHNVASPVPLSTPNTRSPRISLTHAMRFFPSTPPSPPTYMRVTLSPDRLNFHRRLPFPLQSARTAADLLVQWSDWSPWSPCDTGKCTANNTQVRTRECRTKNGTGPRLNDTRLCALLGGVELEVKDCPCTAYVPKGVNQQDSDSFTITSSNSNTPTTRFCNECLPSEVCLALHVDTFPICRPFKDPKDPLGCRGWCDSNTEYCQHLGNNSYRCVDDRLCLIDEWRCKDGLCVPKEKRCDGHFNCFDMTDEYDCECGPDRFHCGNDTSCIPNSKRCDGVIDCWDGKDEANCSKPCDPGFFACNAGGCIPAFRFCDDFYDCSDGSDEPTGCMVNWCTKSEFQCANRRCLTKSSVCDGFDQCGDGSDERNCTVVRNTSNLINNNDLLAIIGCLDSQFECSSGACIRETARCDGKIDCADASDEQNCTQNKSSVLTSCPVAYFKCHNGSCLSDSKVCNGVVDCDAGEDEIRCPTTVIPTCHSNEFTCHNGKCVSKDDLCDLVNDCGDYSDERDCVYPYNQVDTPYVYTSDYPFESEVNETKDLTTS